jgi:NAD(P)H-hydrate epimerase
VPADILPIVAAGNPCYMTAPLPADEHSRLSREGETALLELVTASDVVAFGPGLGNIPAVTSLLTTLLQRTALPLVVNADGLNALQGHCDALRGRSGTILTPHPGELARLLGTTTAAVQAQRQSLAVSFAAEHGVVLVLKGHLTVVTDGQRLWINPTGNPGMATGGSGDVLAGLIAALVGQGLATFAAAQLGVYLHGLAGDLARDDLGETALIATDLLAYLPQAFCRHAASSPQRQHGRA